MCIYIYIYIYIYVLIYLCWLCAMYQLFAIKGGSLAGEKTLELLSLHVFVHQYGQNGFVWIPIACVSPTSESFESGCGILVSTPSQGSVLARSLASSARRMLRSQSAIIPVAVKQTHSFSASLGPANRQPAKRGKIRQHVATCAR